jgi:apolipoprotein D and lipocalin family protein
MRLISVLFLAILATACAAQPVYRSSTAPLPVASVELPRYLGHWHEAARLPNRFEQGCIGASADYGQRPDGLISVTNTCRQAEGGQRTARGRARTTGALGEGKLEVSFFGPFWAKYWVLERAPDYSWSIVGEPSGRYLWLLTRAERISARERAFFETRISALGYRPAEMEWAANGGGSQN